MDCLVFLVLELLPMPLRSFSFFYSLVRKDCCNSLEIYFCILLIVHMPFIYAFNAIT